MKVFALVILTAIALAPVAQAQTYTDSIVYSFGTEFDFSFGPNGLAKDTRGNFYGTVQAAGLRANGSGCGFVYKLTPQGIETVLHTFGCSAGDGSTPTAALAIDKNNNLYGTTLYGGTGSCSFGCGTVFKITSAGKYSVLYKFGKSTGDGTGPAGPLILDTAGNLYGTTQNGGGTCNCGTIFTITPKGTESILYKFAGGSDGGYPAANLLRDGQGNLYGTTTGTVFGNPMYYSVLFKLSSKNVLTTLYNFTSDNNVISYIARSSQGNFYGSFNGATSGLWEVTSAGLRTYYTFVDSTDGTDPSGPLIFAGGNFYGTTYSGGSLGMGTVWKFSPSSGVVTVLYAQGANIDRGDGQSFSGIIIDGSGNLWGTSSGGNYDDGAVFELFP